MVNEESSAKSLHFMVEKGVKPTARLLLNVLKAYLRHRHDKKYFGKEKVASIPRKVVEKRKEQTR